MTTKQKFIGTAEAAAMLGVSPRTIHRMVEAEKLKPAHIAPGGQSGSYLFNQDDVEKLKTT